jgi:hypothetical protein
MTDQDGYEMQGRKVLFRGYKATVDRYLGLDRFDVRMNDGTLYVTTRERLVFLK